MRVDFLEKAVRPVNRSNNEDRIINTRTYIFYNFKACCNALVISLLRKGDPGTTGGNQLKLKKSAPQYPGLSGLLGLFLTRGLGTF